MTQKKHPHARRDCVRWVSVKSLAKGGSDMSIGIKKHLLYTCTKHRDAHYLLRKIQERNVTNVTYFFLRGRTEDAPFRVNPCGVTTVHTWHSSREVQSRSRHQLPFQRLIT